LRGRQIRVIRVKKKVLPLQSYSKRIAAIRARLDQAMISDQRAILQRLRSLGGASGKALPPDRLNRRMHEVERLLAASIQRREDRALRVPNIVYPEHLPIFSKRKEIVEAIRQHPVVIVSGDTGSGKSTQIPKMCLEAGRGIAGRIACTQPRRIAATTVARRIAEELGEDLGGSVGYKIRFSDRTGPESYIKVVTDGMLLAETQQDRFLNEYDTIIIDEAHERSLNIDFLLGLLRILLPRRRDLRVVITSATLDTEKFADAFGKAPVVEVSGRMYPVDVEYEPVNGDADAEEGDSYVDLAVRVVERIGAARRRGDILVFMPTEQDIREACDRIEARRLPGATVLPLFARLPASRQKQVFAPLPGRKIIVATNVAETSLTIPGIRYVVDTGLARIPRYLPSTRTTSLAVAPVSRSSADQRMGRCGRVENGICIRLYSRDDYEKRPEHTPPEVLRSNLAEVILRMLSLKLGDIETFPFVDPPGARSIKDGFDVLAELGAVTREKNPVRLTPRGRLMARLPLDPRISRMMLEAHQEGCMTEVAVIAAALGIQDPRERPLEKAGQADAAHRVFSDKESDFLTLLTIWNRSRRLRSEVKGGNSLRAFCRDHFLSFTRMREWKDIHEQITSILEEETLEGEAGAPPGDAETRYAAVHRSVLSGFLSNIAMRTEKNLYRATRGRDVMLFPGSTLFNRGAPWIVAAEMVRTSRVFARTAARIDPAWLEPLGGSLCRSSYGNPHWEKSRGEVRADQRVTLFGLPIVQGRSVSFGPVDRQEAHRIFVQSALVEGEVNHPPPFLQHNRALVERLASLEDRIRRRDILVSEQAMAAFYSERLPGVCDIRTLKRMIREAGGDAFLHMSEADLAQYVPDEHLLSAYPDRLTLGEHVFGLSYRFEPGAEEDGVTVSVPSTLASRLRSESLDWVVPGLFKEKLTALLKGLPKRYRKQLVPLSETVEVIEVEMERGDEPLVSILGRFLYRRFGVDIPASAWPAEALPEHLRMRVSITDHRGRELRAGRDPGLLLQGEGDGHPAPTRSLEQARARWERDGITAWDFGPLPEHVQVEETLLAFPALEPAETGVCVRLFPSARQAAAVHRKGVARLLALVLNRDLKFARRVLRLPEKKQDAAAFFGGVKAVEAALLEALVRELFEEDVRTPEAFEDLAGRVSAALVPEANALLDRALAVLETYRSVRFTLHRLETANVSNPAVQSLCAAVRQDLSRLLPEDFLGHADARHLEHLPRYIKAMEIRAERGCFDPEKDRKKATDVQGFEKVLGTLQAELSPNATQEKREAIQELAWWLEEYRVSVFAPELTTAVKVSSKRLSKKADEIRRMV